jgi:DNA polymerase-3 subunit epsilon
VIGTSAHPEGTLLQRVMVRLGGGPHSADDLCQEVLGLPNAPRAVCERIAVALLGADPRVRQLADGRWGLVPEARGSPLLDECAFAVVVVSGDRREVVFHSLVNPGRAIPPAICAITHITNDMVRDAPVFAEVADAVLAALAGRIFVAHNARFDWNFVTAELQRSRDLILDGPRLCTVRLARRLLQGVRSCGLDNLTRFFGFENGARHRATGDALVTAELLARLLVLARQEGARTLQDLAAIEARRLAAARRKRRASPTVPLADSCPEQWL